MGCHPNSGKCLAKNLIRVAGGKLLGEKSAPIMITLFISEETRSFDLGRSSAVPERRRGRKGPHSDAVQGRLRYSAGAVEPGGETRKPGRKHLLVVFAPDGLPAQTVRVGSQIVWSGLNCHPTCITG